MSARTQVPARVKHLLALVPKVYRCPDYTDDEGAKHTVTVLVVPLKLSEVDEKTTIIGWACSKGASCMNPNCRYSRAWREEHGAPR